MKVARLLLRAIADKDKALGNGVTLLYLSSQKCYLEVARLLLKANAEKDKANSNGTTPLFIATQQGHFEVVRLLQAADSMWPATIRMAHLSCSWRRRMAAWVSFPAAGGER